MSKKTPKARITTTEVIEKIPEPELIIEGEFSTERVLAQNTQAAITLYDQSRYGELVKGKFQYALVEALHLIERNKMIVKDGKKQLNFDEFVKKARKVEPKFWIRYCAYSDLRNRGYIVKTALKFGADFRVYDRGIKPGEDHAKWIVYPVHEAETLTWYEFAAKNRVAHSTRKRLLIAIVDEEGSCTYYEIAWKRP
ncbi:tRNA-intron lyase [Candidatus Woesearchaeota archaeon]|nr:tRNA-intron lyase [Candidatus Woesearchaeota archaeon]